MGKFIKHEAKTPAKKPTKPQAAAASTMDLTGLEYALNTMMSDPEAVLEKIAHSLLSLNHNITNESASVGVWGSCLDDIAAALNRIAEAIEKHTPAV